MAQIAEIHVMQKLHKEKMKPTANMETTNKKLAVEDEDNKTCGSGKCYSWLRKKVSCAGSKPVISDYKVHNK